MTPVRRVAYQRFPGWLLSVALLLGVLFMPATASANMANPRQPGDPLGEPTGGLESVTIEHETLLIDLRPLADDDPAAVSATYNVRNDGSGRVLHLEFIATGLVEKGAGVWLDNQPVPADLSTAGALPASWQPPKTTPGIGGGTLGYGVRRNGTLTFDLTLTPGPHRILVHYLARATSYSGDSPARYWQLGYVLAPARSWAHFGGLDARVQVPPGWRAASDPALTRNGDELDGSFNNVPSDALALTVQAPFSPSPFADAVAPAAWIVCLAIAIGLGTVAGRWLSRRRRSVAWTIPLAIVVAVLSAIVVVAATDWNPSTSAVPDSQIAWTYDYGRGFVGVGVALLAFVATLVVTPLAAFVGGRKSKQVTGRISTADQGHG